MLEESNTNNVENILDTNKNINLIHNLTKYMLTKEVVNNSLSYLVDCNKSNINDKINRNLNDNKINKNDVLSKKKNSLFYSKTKRFSFLVFLYNETWG